MKTNEAYRDTLNEDELFLAGFGETTVRNRFFVFDFSYLWWVFKQALGAAVEAEAEAEVETE